MPLIPLDECGNVEPVDDGCTVLWDIGEAILTAALAGLVPYAPPEGSPCWPGIQAYVSMDAPPADLCDLLAVYLTSFGPQAGSSNLLNRMATPGLVPEMDATWSVDLWERGYPTVQTEDDRLTVPDPDLLHKVNEHVYRHGLAAYNSVMVGYNDGSLMGSCSKVTFGQLVPLAPQGGCVGWRFTVVTGL